jgi:hypothetical protein
VIFAISRLERIQENRLLVVVSVIATSKAARSGTFLGTGPYFLLVQARMTLEEPLQCKAISLVSSADEQTEQKYHFCEAVASAEEIFPKRTRHGLLPGQAETLRFAVPTLPPAEQGNLAKQTVSFFSDAKGPITNVAVPRTIAFFEVSSADSKTHAPLISIRSTSDILLLAIPTRLLEALADGRGVAFVFC